MRKKKGFDPVLRGDDTLAIHDSRFNSESPLAHDYHHRPLRVPKLDPIVALTLTFVLLLGITYAIHH